MSNRIKIFLSLLFLFCMIGVASAAASAVIDPTSDPSGFLDQLLSFAKTNFAVAIAIGVYGLAEVLALAGKKFPSVFWLAWLGVGRVSLVLGGVAGVLSAGLNSYLGSGSPQTAFVAAVVALAAYWHPKSDAVATARAVARTRTDAPTGIIQPRLIALFALVGITAAVPSCGLWNQIKKMSGDFAGCEETNLGAIVKGTAQNVAQYVADLIDKNTAAIEDALSSLALQVGEGAVHCAIIAYEDTHPAASAFTVTPSTSQPAPTTRSRALAWADAHPVKK